MELKLSDCGLTAVPAALSGVKHTLRKLDLSDNTGLQIDRAGSDTLLSLAALERLDLTKASWTAAGGPDVDDALSFTPALWTLESVRHFCPGWQGLHPGAPAPKLLI